MRPLQRVVERLALIILLIGGAGMLMSMFLGVADVIGTQMLGSAVPGTLELTESTMVLIVFGALTYTQLRRAHIRVELVYTHMGPRVQAAMDVFAGLAGLTFFGLLLWQAVNEALYSIEIREATFGLIRFPLYPARVILAAGTALMVVQLVLHLIEDIGRIRTGAPPRKPEPDAPLGGIE